MAWRSWRIYRSSSLRFERKYKVTDLSPKLMEQVVRQHPAGFRPLHAPRWVNNLYFDTPDFSAFKDNVNGVSQRRKYRLRWYGRPFGQIAAPVLEIKIKDNMMGRKEQFFMGEGGPASTALMAEWVKRCRQQLGMGLELQPLLYNTYLRSYWQAPGYPFRITIDSELQYGAYRAQAEPWLPFREEAVILELKYEAEADKDSSFILQHLPFRLSKSSKYVTGINLAYG